MCQSHTTDPCDPCCPCPETTESCFSLWTGKDMHGMSFWMRVSAAFFLGLILLLLKFSKLPPTTPPTIPTPPQTPPTFFPPPPQIVQTPPPSIIRQPPPTTPPTIPTPPPPSPPIVQTQPPPIIRQPAPIEDFDTFIQMCRKNYTSAGNNKYFCLRQELRESQSEHSVCSHLHLSVIISLEPKILRLVLIVNLPFR